VVVAGDINEAIAAVDMMMVGKKLASAGEKIIIEDCLEGEEVSILVITDGDTVIPLVSSQDHKPVYDNDKGPNSGGMGAYAPAPILNQELLKRINDQIAVPLIQGFKKEGTPYTGILLYRINDKE